MTAVHREPLILATTVRSKSWLVTVPGCANEPAVPVNPQIIRRPVRPALTVRSRRPQSTALFGRHSSLAADVDLMRRLVPVFTSGDLTLYRTDTNAPPDRLRGWHPGRDHVATWLKALLPRRIPA